MSQFLSTARVDALIHCCMVASVRFDEQAALLAALHQQEQDKAHAEALESLARRFEQQAREARELALVLTESESVQLNSESDLPDAAATAAADVASTLRMLVALEDKPQYTQAAWHQARQRALAAAREALNQSEPK